MLARMRACVTSGCLLGMLLLSSCEQQPAGNAGGKAATEAGAKPAAATAQTDATTKTPVAVPLGTSADPAATQPTERDLAALREMIGGKKSEPAGDAALPPGHPPLKPSAAAPSADGLPPNHPPLTPGPKGALAPPPTAPAPGDLKFAKPESWRAEPVRSNLRKAQYSLPAAEGDTEDGELVVFFFGRTDGGSVTQNLERWKSQFSTENGDPVPAADIQQEELAAEGMKVTLIDISGRFTPGPGMGSLDPRDNYRMIGAVLETGEGNWFVRATGPKKTIAQHQTAVKDFLRSARK